jgi:hypothetical protein
MTDETVYNRVTWIKRRNKDYEEEREKVASEYEKFKILGKQLFTSKDGKEFVKLIKKFFLKPNQDLKDESSNDLSLLSRLFGEEYILRKCFFDLIEIDD